MKSLEAFLSEQNERTIETLARYIEIHILEEWEPILANSREELLRIYDKAGEAAYGTYAQRLLRPIQAELKRAGFECAPRFPGTLSTSREWGRLDDRVRWMWSVVRPTQETPMGALVIKLSHDHTQFRIPHPPAVLAIRETETGAIIDALSRASVHFRTAEE
jgi:hypothetical protein